jgi:hypothetical protein
VFVANPKKPPVITAILAKNKDRLVVFLKEFHNDRDGGFRRGDPAPPGGPHGMHHLLNTRIDAKPPTDEQFSDEKAYLIAQSEYSPFNEYSPPSCFPIANQRLFDCSVEHL